MGRSMRSPSGTAKRRRNPIPLLETEIVTAFYARDARRYPSRMDGEISCEHGPTYGAFPKQSNGAGIYRTLLRSGVIDARVPKRCG
jgi:hypothetical protein